MSLGSPIINGPDSNGTVTIYDPDTGLTTTSYSDGSSTVTGNGQNVAYSTPQQLAASAPQTQAGTDWLTAITNALPKVATFLNAQQLAQINVNRARMGQPALDTSGYGPSVGVSMTSSAMSTLMMVGAGLLVLALVLKKR